MRKTDLRKWVEIFGSDPIRTMSIEYRKDSTCLKINGREVPTAISKEIELAARSLWTCEPPPTIVSRGDELAFFYSTEI